MLRSYDFAGTSFFGIILGSSTTAGLAQAVGVAADQTGNYGIMSVLTGILQNPSGLSNAGLYMGNLILLISISFLTWAQQKLSSAGANPQMAMMNTIMPFSWRSSAFRCPEELCLLGAFVTYRSRSAVLCYEKDQR